MCAAPRQARSGRKQARSRPPAEPPSRLLTYKPTPSLEDDDEGEQLIDDLDRLFFAADRTPRGSIERQASIAVHRAAVADLLRRFNDLFEFDDWLFHNERSYLAGRIDP